MRTTRTRVGNGAQLPRPNVINPGDGALFWRGVDDALITMHRGAPGSTPLSGLVRMGTLPVGSGCRER